MMSVECNCPRCGGDDEWAMCQNAYIESLGKISSEERKLDRLIVLFVFFIVCFMGSLFLL